MTPEDFQYGVVQAMIEEIGIFYQDNIKMFYDIFDHAFEKTPHPPMEILPTPCTNEFLARPCRHGVMLALTWLMLPQWKSFMLGHLLNLAEQFGQEKARCCERVYNERFMFMSDYKERLVWREMDKFNIWIDNRPRIPREFDRDVALWIRVHDIGFAEFV